MLERTIDVIGSIKNERGERLISINQIDEAIAMTFPITFSLVIARSEAGYLLVRNRARNVWELPGGFIDAGESPRLCAARELEEESGQSVVCLRWCAVLEIARPSTGTSYGALYCGDIAASARFTSNAEIESVGFWPESELPPDTSNIDRALVTCFAKAVRSNNSFKPNPLRGSA